MNISSKICVPYGLNKKFPGESQSVYKVSQREDRFISYDSDSIFINIHNWLSDNQIFHKFWQGRQIFNGYKQTGEKEQYPSKKVSKEIGEYIDYEEIKK